MAQLTTLPEGFDGIERGALHAILHLATNAICGKDFYCLSDLGGPILRSASASAAAALFRTAAVTIKTWPAWRDQLYQAADISLSLKLRERGWMSPGYWDSPPFVSCLNFAFDGFERKRSYGKFRSVPDNVGLKVCKRWTQPTTSFLLELTRRTGSRRFPSPPTLPSALPPCPSIQKKLYRKLIEGYEVSHLFKTIAKRASNMFGAQLGVDTDLELSQARRVLKGIRKHDAMRIIKTWTNAWTTSFRYHEEVKLPC